MCLISNQKNISDNQVLLDTEPLTLTFLGYFYPYICFAPRPPPQFFCVKSLDIVCLFGQVYVDEPIWGWFRQTFFWPQKPQLFVLIGSRAVCRCREGYVGDPFVECRLEPCSTSPCGTNADCSSSGRYPDKSEIGFYPIDNSDNTFILILA